ncbi:MAG: C40 family peptidase [Armatimonadota bacterium]
MKVNHPVTKTTSAVLTALLICSTITANAATYNVRPGDTLWHIAKKYRTTPQAIAKANGISENAVLKIGKRLYIPTRNAISTKTGHQTVSIRRSFFTHKPTMLVAVKDDVFIRSGPGTAHKALATVSKGTSLKRLARIGNWVKVALGDGRCGYVYRPLVEVAGDIGKSPSATYTGEQSAEQPDIVRTALAFRGARYRRGGASRGGFDCSGFTRYVFAKYGITLPHSSAAQAKIGKPVPKSELQPGDLVFFQTYRRGISHVGIYIGNDKFVHASTHRRGVTVDSLNSSYYASRYRGARRVR